MPDFLKGATEENSDAAIDQVFGITHMRPTTAQPQPTDCLYFVTCVWSRRCKIGRANEVFSRLQRLQAGSGAELLLLGYCSRMGSFEKTLHEHFRSHAMHGEWFSPHVTALVAAVVDWRNRGRPSEQLAQWVQRTLFRTGSRC